MEDVTGLFTVGEWCFVRVENWDEWREAFDTLVDEASEVLDAPLIAELHRACVVSAALFPIWN